MPTVEDVTRILNEMTVEKYPDFRTYMARKKLATFYNASI